MSDDDRYRRFNLRIPKDTFARLQAAADTRSHSMNAEIIQRLEESFEPQSTHEIVMQYAGQPKDLEYARMLLEVTTELAKTAESVAKMTEEDPHSTELDIALSKHQVKIALKDLERARAQVSIMEGNPLPKGSD